MRSFRTWLSIITGVVLVILVITLWPEIEKAFGYLGQVNLWILALLLPAQLISYFATAEVLFSYLRRRGTLRGLSPFGAARMSLEFNFVNHVLPSGGAAGISYIGWKLSHFGVSGGNSTMGQLIRFVLIFVSFIILMTSAVVVLAISGQATALVYWLAGGFVVATLTLIVLFLVLASSRKRSDRFGRAAARFINWLVRTVTFGRKPKVITDDTIAKFTYDLHQDYRLMSQDRRVLIVPFLWSFVANLADVSLFYIAFWALGAPVHPAVVLIAYGLSSITAITVVTPGGAGAYEAVMIAFLASAGVSADIAIAGTLLARVILMVGTIVFGYVFYQDTIMRHGKDPGAPKVPVPPPLRKRLAEQDDSADVGESPESASGSPADERSPDDPEPQR